MAQSKRMEQEQVIAAPAVLSPRSRSRKATKEWKENQRSRNPAAYKAKRAEQERNRLRKQKERVAAKAAFAAEEYVPSGPMPPPSAAAVTRMPAYSIARSGNAAVELTSLVPPPLGDATTHYALPYGLVPPPPSPIPPPLLSPSVKPFTPLAPPTLAPPARPPAPPVTSDGRTFEQRKIKELEAKITDLTAAVQTRDDELKGFADSLYRAVEIAMEVRDAPRSPSDLLVLPPCVRVYPHQPEDAQCRCAFCFALSFLALPLAQRAAYIERARAENA